MSESISEVALFLVAWSILRVPDSHNKNTVFAQAPLLCHGRSSVAFLSKALLRPGMLELFSQAQQVCFTFNLERPVQLDTK